MRNLYPLAARGEARADVEEALRVGEANWDGSGWTGIHEIKPPSVRFGDEGLTPPLAAAILGSHLPKVARFVANIGPIDSDAADDPWGVYDDDPLCFGSEDAFIKVDVEDGAIRGIWFDLNPLDEQAVAQLRSALIALDAETPCFIADYWREVTVVVSDGRAVDAYFAALAAHARDVRDRFGHS